MQNGYVIGQKLQGDGDRPPPVSYRRCRGWTVTIVGVADLLVLVHARQAEGQATRALAGFGPDLVHVEGRIRHDVIAASIEVVRVVIEGVGRVPGFDPAREPVHRHIHEAELGVVFHLFLPVEGHRGVGVHPGRVDEIAALDEHAAASARAV